MSGSLHAPAAFSPRKELQYPLDRRLVGPKAGVDFVAKKKHPALPGMDPHTPQQCDLTTWHTQEKERMAPKQSTNDRHHVTISTTVLLSLDNLSDCRCLCIDISPQEVETGSGDHQASFSVSTADSFHRGKSTGHKAESRLLTSVYISFMMHMEGT
jgi:hypothetical protein